MGRPHEGKRTWHYEHGGFMLIDGSSGEKTYFSKGSEKNLKITTVEDIEIFKALLSAKNEEWIK